MTQTLEPPRIHHKPVPANFLRLRSEVVGLVVAEVLGQIRSADDGGAADVLPAGHAGRGPAARDLLVRLVVAVIALGDGLGFHAGTPSGRRPRGRCFSL